MRKITIIGGGASGAAAAIFAARAGAEVTVIERKDRVLKKLLQTGNGRCNFTNECISAADYYGNDREFASAALSGFGYSEAVEFFESLGVGHILEGGRAYPRSCQASSVVDMLRLEMDRLNVSIHTNTFCAGVLRDGGGFVVNCGPGGCFSSDALIYCAGGAAALPAGERVDHSLIAALGHKVIPHIPALVQLKSKDSFIRQMSGQRAKARVSAYSNGRAAACREGELLFTDYGVSGIVILSLSLPLAGLGNISLSINFLPEFTRGSVSEALNERFSRLAHVTLENFFCGLLSKRIGQALIKRAGIGSLARRAGELSAVERERVIDAATAFEISVNGDNGFKNAQASAGGVDTSAVNPSTMESKLVPGLYFCGEALDITGDCGGYNLHWAWASAYAAAKSAARTGGL